MRRCLLVFLGFGLTAACSQSASPTAAAEAPSSPSSEAPLPALEDHERSDEIGKEEPTSASPAGSDDSTPPPVAWAWAFSTDGTELELPQAETYPGWMGDIPTTHAALEALSRTPTDLILVLFTKVPVLQEDTFEGLRVEDDETVKLYRLIAADPAIGLYVVYEAETPAGHGLELRLDEKVASARRTKGSAELLVPAEVRWTSGYWALERNGSFAVFEVEPAKR